MAKDRMGNQEKQDCKPAGTRSHLSPAKVERIDQRRMQRNMPSGEMFAAARARGQYFD